MRIEQCDDHHFVIIHGGLEVAQDFFSEAEAWAWADDNIDDQVFDSPNWFAEPIAYRPTTDPRAVLSENKPGAQMATNTP